MAEPGGLLSMGLHRLGASHWLQQQQIIRIIHHEQVGFLFEKQECLNLFKCIWIVHI